MKSIYAKEFLNLKKMIIKILKAKKDTPSFLMVQVVVSLGS